jgi:hypothetical protein
VQTGRANQRDEGRAVPLLQDIPPLPAVPGAVNGRPAALQGDRGYGFPWIIAAVLLLGVGSLLAERGKDKAHGSGLGRTRYVVERTLAWFSSFRRLKVCYEASWHSWQGFHELAACVICANRLHRLNHPPQTRRRRHRRL